TAMITIVIIAVLVIAADAIFYFFSGRKRFIGGSELKRRFGPEYDRAVARHDGDTKGAERELSERVKRYVYITEQPLSPEAHEH
ncbi:hypothetical protein Q6280_28060, partial [Klebsiella pneumoniae]|uniref:hypothetical protein n=1 Tax=Klebsiella pneumoniae TaxID=573 RepID=UPI002732228D